MDSLLSTYASSSDDEPAAPPPPSSSRLFSSLPPPKPSPSSLFSSLPPPKSSPSSTSTSSLFSSLPPPKPTSLSPPPLFSTLPPPKPSNPLGLSKPIIKFTPPLPKQYSDSDSDNESKTRKPKPIPPTLKPTSSLILPAPKNTTLGPATSSRRSAIQSAPAVDVVPDVAAPVVEQEVEVSGYQDYGNYGEGGVETWAPSYGGDWGVGPEVRTAPDVADMGRIAGKRARKGESIQMVEVKQDELMKNRPREDKHKATGVAFGPAYQPVASGKGKPTKLHKRKHQIGSLYFDMKQNEMELSERRSRGFLTKAETQAKYGW